MRPISRRGRSRRLGAPGMTRRSRKARRLAGATINETKSHWAALARRTSLLYGHRRNVLRFRGGAGRRDKSTENRPRICPNIRGVFHPEANAVRLSREIRRLCRRIYRDICQALAQATGRCSHWRNNWITEIRSSSRSLKCGYHLLNLDAIARKSPEWANPRNASFSKYPSVL